MTNTNKRVFLGGTWFTLPFKAHGLWVDDATGKSVAEAVDYVMAKALADTLNKEYTK